MWFPPNNTYFQQLRVFRDDWKLQTRSDWTAHSSCSRKVLIEEWLNYWITEISLASVAGFHINRDLQLTLFMLPVHWPEINNRIDYSHSCPVLVPIWLLFLVTCSWISFLATHKRSFSSPPWYWIRRKPHTVPSYANIMRKKNHLIKIV